jgi:biopolymer transport protein ExbD
MGEIIENESGHKKGSGRRAPKKHGSHIDMTPMVDLMCLLITFFMLTTAFSKPKVMEITMPEKNTETDPADQPKVAADRTFSILLTADDKVYWYWHKETPEGQAKKNERVFTEIYELKEKVKKGELVMEDDSLNARIKRIKKSDKKSPIILIKADEKTKYKSIVNVVDEMAICNIANYAIVDIAPEEKALIDKAPK